MANKNQIILDADGVLLHYTEAFFSYMEHCHGIVPAISPKQLQSFVMSDAFPSYSVQDIFHFVKEFSRHPAFEFISPIDGAVEGLGLLRRFVPDLEIHVVTSCGDHVDTAQMRTRCIHGHFGNDVVVHAIGLGGEKHEKLSSFASETLFVDDAYKNVASGKRAGLDVVWFKPDVGLIYKDMNEEAVDMTPVRGWSALTKNIMNKFGIAEPEKTLSQIKADCLIL